MSQGTLFDRVWEGRVVEPLPGLNALVFVDRVVAYELTAPMGAMEIDERFGGALYDPSRIVAINDHIAPAKDSDSAQMVQILRTWAKRHGIRMYDVGENGICHVVVPERGYVHPGTVVTCGDSHTCTLGAFGAFALGVGTSALAGAMLAGALVLGRPKVMRVRVDGRLHSGATAKDLALTVVHVLGAGGGTGYVLEYTGEAIAALSMEERMTLCNMAVEAGATSGMIAPDETTIEYLREREYAPSGDAFERAAQRWRALRAAPDAIYDAEIAIDASAIVPTVTWGTNPGECVALDERVPADADAESLAYMGLRAGDAVRGLDLDQAFIGSCTNARLDDLRAAADVLRGRRVRVPTIVTPGSQSVRRAAEREGLHDVFQDAGALWTHASCGACPGLSMGVLAPQMRCISSSNRNFPGRMGAGGRVHLASPAVVAASAVLGAIGSPADLPPLPTEREPMAAAGAA